MKAILISIKPEFVEQIRKGVKHFEYRKKIFKDQDVKEMYIYSSAPVKQVVALCHIKRVLNFSPKEVWQLTSQASGISQDFFFSYFEGRENAYAIEIEDIKFYTEPISLQDLGVKRAPQSFQYIHIRPEDY